MQAPKLSLCFISALLVFAAVNATASTAYITDATELVSGFGNAVIQPNVLATNGTYSSDGQSGTAYADINTGSMGVQSTGTVASDYGIINDATYAFMGDTITVSGSTGLLKLALDLNIDGSSTLSDPTQNVTFVGVYAFTPGTFDTADFTAPGQVLFNEGFVIGSGTQDYSSDFTAYDLTYAGSYGTGRQNIPLNIPFATLGSSFDLLITLESYESGSSLTGNNWDLDYYHTLTASLSAPDGVTLTSGSGVFPGTTSAVPEPKSTIPLAAGLLMLCLWRRSRTKLAAAR